jgi:hypothetical protein
LLAAPDTDARLTALLGIMAGLEAAQRAAPRPAGAIIASLMVNPEGRARLLQAARSLRLDHPNSAYLTHLVALSQALAGDYRAASADLIAQLSRPYRADDPAERRRFDILRNTWRVVDLAAREQMDWATEGVGEGMGEGAGAENIPADMPLAEPETTAETAAETPTATDSGSRTLIFKEQALQNRQRSTYLAACDTDLTQARTLAEALQAMADMLRPSVRHSPSYATSFDLARGRLIDRQADWAGLLAGPVGTTSIEQIVLDLCSLLNLARKLERADTVQQCLNRLETLSQTPAFLPYLWPAPAEIVHKAAAAPLAAKIIGRILAQGTPQTNRDVKAYFQWAATAQDHAGAHRIFAALPDRLRHHNGVLHYATILQREGRFAESLSLVRDVHAQLMAHPARVNAVSSRGMIKRVGELEFLIQTAEIMGRVPQPTDPVGIVLIAPRNVDHLRRYPLLVLLEMKRAGWAVVPLVAGLLPFEATGDPAIDILNGAISPNIRLNATVEATLPPITDFVADPAQGKLRWGSIDLSHQLWEDAAISRRRYSIDWGCPELRAYLGGLCDWTAAMGRCLDHARAVHQQTKLPVASMSLFSARLPDGLFRFYCATQGDPKGFFYLHAANGYQNYFTNFSTNLSTRFVLRNMTRHPHARSASFPLPDHFDRYCAANMADAPALLERFDGITRVTRSTGGAKVMAPEAQAALDRIADWRAGGGRVVCAFGKVVCDSSVPFDGGPAHSDMQDWINHAISAVQGSRTLLLIKPHPHEINNLIATFPTEYFADLITEPLGDNAMILGHRWFDIAAMQGLIDLGLIYNGTTAIELGLMGIPCLLAGHFAPIDYPIGHAVPQSRADFAAAVRFETPVDVAPDIRERAALWLDYMSREDFTLPYRYHTRPVTNKVLYPPRWIAEDLARYDQGGDLAASDPGVAALLGRALGTQREPGGNAG